MKSIHHNINDLLTIVIVSYKSSKTIEPILNRYSHLFKIIIIENSRDKNLRKKIKKNIKKLVYILKIMLDMAALLTMLQNI